MGVQPGAAVSGMVLLKPENVSAASIRTKNFSGAMSVYFEGVGLNIHVIYSRIHEGRDAFGAISAWILETPMA